MSPRLAKSVVRIAAALLRHQARAWLGDEFMDALGDTALGELERRVDAWLQAETTAAALLQAAQTADRYFQDRCDDPALVQALTLNFGTLPDVQSALADLPRALDARGVEDALREALTRDLGRALTREQIERGARLYAEALQAAVGTLKDFAQPVLLQIALQTRAEQREGFAALQQKLDHILALLQAGRLPSDEQAALLQEALRQGLVIVIVQGDVTGSVILIGAHNRVTLNAEQVAVLKRRVTLPGDLPPGSYLPFSRNAVFTGRAEALRELAAALLPGDDTARGVLITQAVVGSGGVGKTQLAVEFAYRYGYRFRGVHWLDLHDPDLLDEQIARCGEEMGLKQAPDEERAAFARRVVEHWKADGPRLLILDNLEAPAAAREVRRRLHHHNLRLLLTARRRDWPKDLGLSLLRLDVFTPGESRAFLRHHLPRERATDQDLDALAERVGHLPLALELAGRYLARQPYLTVAEYLRHLEDIFAHPSMQDWRPDLGSPTDHDLNLRATFLLSWQQVQNPDARRLFSACGFLAPNTPIPQAILRLVVPDPAALGEAVSDLVGLALLEQGPAIHPLLAEFARGLAGAQDPALLRALADLASEINAQIAQTADYARFTPLLPHVRAAAAHAERLDPPAAARLWNELGYHLYHVADYTAARQAYERALGIWEQHLGEDHPRVATAVNNLGSVLQDLGDLAGARACLERALGIDEAAFGPDHPNVARDVNNLGGVLWALGDLAGARACFERALRIDEAAFGPDHPNVAIRVNNLGSVLWALGDLAGARACFERALGIWEQHLGEDHPHVATVVNNLGLVLQDLGELQEAKACFERALGIDEAAFGPDHPNVARDVNNLGGVLQDLGDLAGARACYERALGILKRSLPADHPHIRTVAGNLAAVEEALGREG